MKINLFISDISKCHVKNIIVISENYIKHELWVKTSTVDGKAMTFRDTKN